MTVDEARIAYARILTVLRKERDMRQKHLGEPRRSKAVGEIDDALKALESLGIVLAKVAVAGVLESGHEQQPLIDVPERKPYL